jgi:hypothetical protein
MAKKSVRRCSEFLEKNPRIRRKELQKKWFREEKIDEEKQGPPSVAQTSD